MILKLGHVYSIPFMPRCVYAICIDDRGDGKLLQLGPLYSDIGGIVAEKRVIDGGWSGMREELNFTGQGIRDVLDKLINRKE